MQERNELPPTALILAAGAGDPRAADALLPLVYAQLRAIAGERMALERRDHTLQATALVHEAYLKLVGAGEIAWSGHAGFFCAASDAMRRILIDHARRHHAEKRAGNSRRVAFQDVADLASTGNPDDIVAFDDAVVRLEQEHPEVARVVRLRFYGGLTVEQTAQVLE